MMQISHALADAASHSFEPAQDTLDNCGGLGEHFGCSESVSGIFTMPETRTPSGRGEAHDEASEFDFDFDSKEMPTQRPPAAQAAMRCH